MNPYDRMIWRVGKILENAFKAWQHTECHKRAEEHAERLREEIHEIERLFDKTSKRKT